MRHAGIQFAALLLMAFIAINAQCVALCSVGICPVPPEDAPHTHCPHHQNRKAPVPVNAHNCAPQQPFLARNASEAFPAPAAAGFVAVMATQGALPAIAPRVLTVLFEASPPGISAQSRPVLRI
jgi:hypothetical protein